MDKQASATGRVGRAFGVATFLLVPVALVVLSGDAGTAPPVADASVTPREMSLGATHGTLSLGGVTGLSFTTGDGTADPDLVFTGTVTDINNALSGLTFTGAADYNGAAQLSVTADDQGQTGSGGPKTAGGTVAITVNAVNDAPRGVADASHAVTGNVQIQVPAPGLLTGVTDVEGNALIPQIDASNASVGDIAVNTDGSWSYNPKAGHEGTDMVKFKVCDDGAPAACSPVVTLTLNVSNMIWFVKDTGPVGDGRLTSPFNSLGAFQAVNNGTGDNPAANDSVFLHAGGYTGPVTLLAGQKLVGAGSTVSLSASTAISPTPDSDSLPATGSLTPPTISTSAPATNAVNLGSGNLLRGFGIGNRTGTGIAGNGFGTLTASEVSIDGSGPAIDLGGAGSLAATFPTVTSTSTSTSGVKLNGAITGTLTMSGGSLSGAAGAELDINTGSADVTYGGAIQGSAGPTISVTNHTGGTVAFTGSVSTAATPGGVTLESNTGATITFSGGLALSTGANAAFATTGGGTVNVTGSANTLATTTGTPLTVTNTTIGASGIRFVSIASNGAPSGIVLTNTGSSGGLTVTGSGSPASGGTIQASTGDGISLTSTSNVKLSRMDIKTSADSGLEGTLVTGLQLAGLRVQNNTNALVEAGILLTNLRGTNTVTDTEVSGSTEDNVRVVNDSGTLDGITFSGAGCLIKDNSSVSGNVGINVQANLTALMNGVVVDGCRFTGNRTVAVRGDVADGSQLGITAHGNVIAAGSPNVGNQGIEISSASTGQVTFDLDGNKVGIDGVTPVPLLNTGINVFAGNTSTMTGKVRNNVVHNAGNGISGFGIRVFQSLNSAIHASVTGNTVDNVGLDYGLLAEASGGSSPAAGQARLDVGVTGNNVSVLSTALDAIRVQARNVNTVCARVNTNVTSAGGTGFFGLFLRQANTAVTMLEGASGLGAQNPGAATVGTVGTITAVPDNSCSIPS